MLINLQYDSSVQSAPQSFSAALQTAVNIIERTFVDDITLNFAVGYGEITLGGTTTTLTNGDAEGGSGSGTFQSYASTRALLAQNLDPAVQSGVSALPLTSTFQGQSRVLFWSSEA